MIVCKGHVVALLATPLAGAVLLVATASSAPLETKTLDLRGSLIVSGGDTPCPPDIPAVSTACHLRTAKGRISGLGDVTHTYMYNAAYAPCGGRFILDGNLKILGYTTSAKVAGKGEIEFTVADAATCIPPTPAALLVTQSFTVTGGSGIYAGASGSGRIERTTALGALAMDIWIGTLNVPGLEFDTTPPTLSGATSKTVRAPKGVNRVRVTYKVTATDAVDRAVPVLCTPRSGSRFRIGRTVVKCAASDSSGNTANAAFRVLVRRTP